MALQDFITGYLVCALWSSTDSDDSPLDAIYSVTDISIHTTDLMKADCKAFYEANSALWEDAIGYSDSRAGHDFWLTRNHHGAGFWDREEIRETRDKLTEIAHVYGGFDLYVGDNQLIYSDKG